jgi:predicted HTH domain antitoxin
MRCAIENLIVNLGMKTLVLNIPDTLDLDDKEALMIVASKLYEKGKVTLGQGAEIAGLSKRTFMELLGQYGVSIFNLSADDLDRDISNAKDYHI